ncbi:Bifunctional solanapyrone synthase [Cytospora mali]|uniref:Bifunctional solanapyrone synthase n=1 Tax=Cytospora mali TaxID=578113 RepID=A0A194UYE1_CYTMA|nr:Bifunctional solanapyrone synthase [Valsa mali var. pyri (nom. inval.)]
MNQIPAVAILPITLGGSIDFFTGHFPTAPDTMTTATGAAATTFSSSMFTPIFTTTRNPIPTGNNTNSIQSEQVFSKTDKIGTAVGVAVFGLIALTSLGYFLLRGYRQKRVQQQHKQQEENAIDPFLNAGYEYPPANIADPHNSIGSVMSRPLGETSPYSYPDINTISELDTVDTQPWSMRSELDSNILNVEIVLANGSIINANKDQDNDLWRALKGGSGNMELVTRFNMNVVDFSDADVTNIWGGLAYYNLSSADELIDVYVEFVEPNHRDKNSSAMLYWVYDYTGKK